MSISELQDCIDAAEHQWELHIKNPKTVRAVSILAPNDYEIGVIRNSFILNALKSMARGEWLKPEPKEVK